MLTNSHGMEQGSLKQLLWARGLLDFKLLKRSKFLPGKQKTRLHRTNPGTHCFLERLSSSHFPSFLTFFFPPGSSLDQFLQLTKCEKDTLGELGSKKGRKNVFRQNNQQRSLSPPPLNRCHLKYASDHFTCCLLLPHFTPPIITGKDLATA